jgi:hypothetical protein
MIKKLNDFKTIIHLKKIFLASIILGISSFVLNKLGVGVLINIALSAGIYFIALFLLKEKVIEEGKEILRAARS